MHCLMPQHEPPRAIVNLAHSLEIEVIAEGIESAQLGSRVAAR
jgi:EAL domain-containing protein (putative c-di-GMP-specific phosphodiesterase class I)